MQRSVSHSVAFALGLAASYPALLAYRHVRYEGMGPLGTIPSVWRHAAMAERAKRLPAGGVVVIGDSIAQYWADAPGWLRMAEAGGVNCGMAGYRARDVRWRIGHGALSGEPRCVVLVVGVNDIIAGASGRAAAERIASLAEESKRHAGEVVVVGILPCADSRVAAEAKACNARLAADGGFAFVSTDGLFPADEEHLPDGLHLSSAAYDALTDAVLPLLGEPGRHDSLALPRREPADSPAVSRREPTSDTLPRLDPSGSDARPAR